MARISVPVKKQLVYFRKGCHWHAPHGRSLQSTSRIRRGLFNRLPPPSSTSILWRLACRRCIVEKPPSRQSSPPRLLPSSPGLNPKISPGLSPGFSPPSTPPQPQLAVVPNKTDAGAEVDSNLRFMVSGTDASEDGGEVESYFRFVVSDEQPSQVEVKSCIRTQAIASSANEILLPDGNVIPIEVEPCLKELEKAVSVALASDEEIMDPVVKAPTVSTLRSEFISCDKGAEVAEESSLKKIETVTSDASNCEVEAIDFSCTEPMRSDGAAEMDTGAADKHGRCETETNIGLRTASSHSDGEASVSDAELEQLEPHFSAVVQAEMEPMRKPYWLPQSAKAMEFPLHFPFLDELSVGSVAPSPRSSLYFRQSCLPRSPGAIQPPSKIENDDIVTPSLNKRRILSSASSSNSLHNEAAQPPLNSGSSSSHLPYTQVPKPDRIALPALPRRRFALQRPSEIDVAVIPAVLGTLPALVSHRLSPLKATPGRALEQRTRPGACSGLLNSARDQTKSRSAGRAVRELQHRQVSPIRNNRFPVSSVIGEQKAAAGSSPTSAEVEALEQLYYGDVAVRLVVEPVAIVLGLCCQGLSYSAAFTTSNRGRVPVSIAVEVPRKLKRHVRVEPPALRLRPGERRKLAVILCAKRSFGKDAHRFTCPWSRVVQFPVEITPVSKAAAGHRPVRVQMLAAVSTPMLEVVPAVVDFGTFSCVERSTVDIKLLNKSLMTQLYGFTNLPEDISVEPNGGFGEVRAGHSVELRLTYSPSEDSTDGPRAHTLQLDSAMGMAAQQRESSESAGRKAKGLLRDQSACHQGCTIQVRANLVTPRVCLSSSCVQLPRTPVGSSSTHCLTLSCRAFEARFEFETGDDQLQVSPLAGQLLNCQVLAHNNAYHTSPQSIRVTLMFQPRPIPTVRNELFDENISKLDKSIQVHCVVETRMGNHDSWRREVVPLLVRCPVIPAALTPVSQTCCFSAVAVGCWSRLTVEVLNSSSSWQRVRPSVPAPRAAFWWPPFAVDLPPRQALKLPVTCAPHTEHLEVCEIISLQYTELDGPAGDPGTTKGMAAVNLSARAVKANFRLIPDAAVIRLEVKSGQGMKLKDSATFRIQNTCDAPLEFTVADVRAFELVRAGLCRTSAADAMSESSRSGRARRAEGRAERAERPRMSKAMTDWEAALLRFALAEGVNVGFGAAAGDGVGPFRVLPALGVSVPAGGHQLLHVEFSPPSLDKQYVGLLELRLGTDRPIRNITCFGNAIQQGPIPMLNL